jgi:hypothetical protein
LGYEISFFTRRIERPCDTRQATRLSYSGFRGIGLGGLSFCDASICGSSSPLHLRDYAMAGITDPGYSIGIPATIRVQ